MQHGRGMGTFTSGDEGSMRLRGWDDRWCFCEGCGGQRGEG